MKKNKIKLYIAAPIFSEADRMYNEVLATKIEDIYPEVDVYLPQRNTSINDKTKCASAEDICVGDFTNNLDKDDIVVALVDGNAAPGIGTTLEIGYFSRICQEEIEKFGSTKKKIISLYTDSRECSNTYLEAKNEMLKEFAECQYSYLNLLLVGCLKRYGVMCRTIEEVVVELGKALDAYREEESRSLKYDFTHPKNVSFDPIKSSKVKTIVRTSEDTFATCPTCGRSHGLLLECTVPATDYKNPCAPLTERYTKSVYRCPSCGEMWIELEVLDK